MVSLKELRIGNIVQVGTIWAVVDYLNNDSDGIGLQGNAIINRSDQIDPIELTTEILHKAGFEKHRDSNEYWNHWVLKNGWCVSEWIGDCPIAGFEEKGVYYWGEEYIPIRHLHSLQNFYFCHTSQELQI